MAAEATLILVFWGAILGGLLLGLAVGWWRGTLWGVAVGCLVIGLGASTAAGSLAWNRWQFVSRAVLVQGTLVGFHDGPDVVFHTPDGASHTVHGLGGSQSGALAGDSVPVRYPAADPGCVKTR